MQNNEMSAETKAEQSKNVDDTSVSQTIAKPNVSGSLQSIEHLKGGVHYSTKHKEFRTTFLGDWDDIEKALSSNDR